MKPIRVLHVLTIMVRGGAETMVMNYYRKINRDLVQFDFLVHRQERSDFDDEIEQLGGVIHRLPSISPKNYFNYKRALNAFFDEHPEYKIVHCHINGLGHWVLKASKQKGVPVRIAHAHNAYEPWFRKLFLKNADVKATIKTTIQAMLRYGVRKNASHNFACGEKAGKWLFGPNMEEKPTIIHNAIDAELFRYDENAGKMVKKELQIENCKVIGHIGSFTEAKNHIFSLNVFKEVHTLDENTRLVFVGDGPFRKKIEQQISRLGLDGKVLLLGVRDDIPRLVQGFDLFLFPSLYEGLPVTLLEAQAGGLQIVLSENITREVAITNLTTYLPLDLPVDQWGETVKNKLEYLRRDTYEEIVERNYDINQNAAELQKFYLGHY